MTHDGSNHPPRRNSLSNYIYIYKIIYICNYYYLYIYTMTRILTLTGLHKSASPFWTFALRNYINSIIPSVSHHIKHAMVLVLTDRVNDQKKIRGTILYDPSSSWVNTCTFQHVGQPLTISRAVPCDNWILVEDLRLLLIKSVTELCQLCHMRGPCVVAKSGAPDLDE
jgi:hypothetical protein